MFKKFGGVRDRFLGVDGGYGLACRPIVSADAQILTALCRDSCNSDAPESTPRSPRFLPSEDADDRWLAVTMTKGNKPLTPRAHSIIDYLFTAGNLTIPSIIGMSGATKALFAGFGVVQGTLNALTTQPYAARQVVPFKLHGLIEKGSLPIYIIAPILVGAAREPRARAYWIAVGLALVTVYNLTDWNARHTGR